MVGKVCERVASCTRGGKYRAVLGKELSSTLIHFLGERVRKCVYGYFVLSAVKARGPNAPGMGDFMATLQSYNKIY